MTSRKWIRFFFSTLCLGGVSTIITGFLLRWNTYMHMFYNLQAKEILTVMLGLLGIGFIFSVMSQMGFFAYLTIHRFGILMFRSPLLWNGVQVIFIVFFLFDFVYLRSFVYTSSILTNILLALVLFSIAILTALIKSKETKRQAFIPAVFFMVVVTIVEWTPALRINNLDWIYMMLVPLLLCNAYQMLQLHRIVSKEKVMYKG
ncbi:KinB-signaling pathway activation protein [Ectobacillus polymachus]|uniref:KinB-signaling pathway activation protein n=1 Tax=Ectobacillus polymachus TaxID=1508806 RepID=UPI003A8366A8